MMLISMPNNKLNILVLLHYLNECNIQTVISSAMQTIDLDR